MPVGKVFGEEPVAAPGTPGAAAIVNERSYGQLTAPLLEHEQQQTGSILKRFFFGIVVGLGFVGFAAGGAVSMHIYDARKEAEARGHCDANKTCELIYVVGGCQTCDEASSVSSVPSGAQFHKTVATLETYDPLTGLWNSSYPPLPKARSMLAFVEVDNMLYAIGGIHGGNASGPCKKPLNGSCPMPPKPTGDVSMFDPINPQRWQARSSMPYPTWGLGAAVLNGDIYAVGGFIHADDPQHFGTASSIVLSYTPAGTVWIKRQKMLSTRVHPAVTVQGGNL